MSEPEDDGKERREQAYNHMVERVRHALTEAEERTAPTLQRAVDYAKRQAVELGELTRNEAEWIGDYVRRDLHDAGEYLSREGADLRQWLRFDLELIERQLLEMFSQAADQTRLEWLRLQQELERGERYHTGEITGPGSLQCVACGEVVAFHHTGHIPPCPRCHGTEYVRPHRAE